MFGTQAVLNSLYEVIILPVTIRVVNYIKKVDGNDVYDVETSYNILNVRDLCFMIHNSKQMRPVLTRLRRIGMES